MVDKGVKVKSNELTIKIETSNPFEILNNEGDTKEDEPKDS